MGWIHEQEFLTAAARRPHRQPAPAVLQGNAIVDRAAQLLDVELLGRFLV
jgi:hypothetical protein